MIKISKKDFDFRNLIDCISQKCSGIPALMLSCFWGLYCEEVCSNILLAGEGKRETYKGECPIGKMFQDIRKNAPFFLVTWRNLYNEVHWKKGYCWLMFSLGEISTFYSINDQRVPSMDEKFVKRLIETPIGTIVKELIMLDSSWFYDSYNLAISQGITLAELNKFLRLLNVFLKGIKPIEPFRNEKEKEELYREVVNFLNLTKK